MGTFGVKRASDEPFCPSTVSTADPLRLEFAFNLSSKNKAKNQIY